MNFNTQEIKEIIERHFCEQNTEKLRRRIQTEIERLGSCHKDCYCICDVVTPNGSDLNITVYNKNINNLATRNKLLVTLKSTKINFKEV